MLFWNLFPPIFLLLLFLIHKHKSSLAVSLPFCLFFITKLKIIGQYPKTLQISHRVWANYIIQPAKMISSMSLHCRSSPNQFFETSVRSLPVFEALDPKTRTGFYVKGRLSKLLANRSPLLLFRLLWNYFKLMERLSLVPRPQFSSWLLLSKTLWW